MAGYLQLGKRTRDHCWLARHDLALAVPDEHRSWVSGAGVRQKPAKWFVHRAKNRHEHIHRVLRCERMVDPPENVFWSLELRAQSAYQRHRYGHKEGGGNALPGDVPDHDYQPAVGGAEDLEEIAAHFLGWLQNRMHLNSGVAGDRGNIRRQDAQLNLARDAQFAGKHRLDRIGIRFGLEQGAHAGFDFEDLEWFDEVIVAADFEALSFVLHLFERAQEHDRNFPRGGRGAQSATDFVPIQARHHDIEQNQVGRGLFDAAEGALAIQRDAQLIIVAQSLNQHIHIGAHVIHDQDSGFRQISHRNWGRQRVMVSGWRRKATAGYECRRKRCRSQLLVLASHGGAR